MRETFFLKNHAANEADRLTPDLFFFFRKALYEVKASDPQLKYISIALNLVYNENKLYKTLDY